MIPKYHLDRKIYPRDVLQKMADKNGFTANNRQLEDARCEADLMYALFRRPKEIIPKMLAGFLEIIKKKNSPKLELSKVARDGIAFLIDNPRAADCVKLYIVLRIINREPEAKELIRSSHLAQHPGNIWENNYVAHFERFLRHLAELYENADTASFGAGNIIEYVRSLVLCAEQLYMSK
jgi:hypothetical protein